MDFRIVGEEQHSKYFMTCYSTEIIHEVLLFSYTYQAPPLVQLCYYLKTKSDLIIPYNEL